MTTTILPALPAATSATIRASRSRGRCDYCDLGACRCASSLAIAPVGVVTVTDPAQHVPCRIVLDDVSGILWVDQARWVPGALSPHVVAPLADVAGLL